MINRCFDDEPPPYNDGPKQLPLLNRQMVGPLMAPHHETVVTEDAILLVSIGGQTKLEAAAVDLAVALIHTEALNLTDLFKDPGLQLGLGQAAVKIASAVLASAENTQTRPAGDQGR